MTDSSSPAATGDPIGDDVVVPSGREEARHRGRRIASLISAGLALIATVVTLLSYVGIGPIHKSANKPKLDRARQSTTNVIPTSQTGRIESGAARELVIVRKGALYVGSACLGESCHYVAVSAVNFPPRSYQDVKCLSDDGSTALQHSYQATVDAIGTSNTEVCVFGRAGTHVWAIVGGVESKHLTW